VAKIVIFGAGNIGFRHFQAACATPAVSEILIVEPSMERLEKALTSKDAEGKKVRGANSTEILSKETGIDCLISAVTTDVQTGLSPFYFELEPRVILLEKPVSQSKAGLEKLIHFSKGGSAVYVNCGRNVGKGIQEVRQAVSGKRIHLEVFGNNWGLGCNMVHFVELFRYLTGAKDISAVTAEISTSPYPNKRGEKYEEFLGTAAFLSGSGDSLSITCGASDPRVSGISLLLRDRETDRPLYLIEEKARTLTDLVTSSTRPLGDLFVSESTRVFLEAVLNINDRSENAFPTMEEAAISHRAYFDALFLGLKRNEFKVT
jgi:predicted dehydrogenase